MKSKYAEFWVCAEPEEVTRLLRMEPTSTIINQPYSYWQLRCSGEKYGADCLSVLLKILQSREVEIIAIESKYAVGVNWVQIIEPETSDYENNCSVEAEEMALLARLNAPLCTQVWLKDHEQLS